MRQILHKPNLVERMVAWMIQFFEFRIIYEQRKAKKVQVLADFVVEMTKPKREPPT